MIIYGTNGALVRTAPMPSVACPSCAAPGTMQLSLFSRYVHIYWVPVLPYSKPVVAVCSHCQLAWEEKTMPATLQGTAREIKRGTRAPFWHWSGLMLIAAGMAWATVASTANERENKAYLAAPQAGDIYTVQSTENKSDYSLLKVISARGNAVELVANEYQIDNNNPIDELNAPDKYSKESFSLTQLDLQIMKNKGQLTDVDRLGQ